MSDQGFFRRTKMRRLPAPAASAQPLSTEPSRETAPAGPEAIHFAAQNRFTSEGKKLVAEEKAKRERHPLDRWDELLKRAEAGEFPKGTDIFCTNYAERNEIFDY